jgi:hypothetical protein
MSFDPKDAYKGPAPLAVLLETDPWAMLIGADTPRIVIYEDGTVIFRILTPHKNTSYYTVKLPEEQLQEISDNIQSFGRFDELDNDYDVEPDLTDQPAVKIYLNLSGKEYIARIYGLSAANINETSALLPPQISRLYKYLCDLTFGNSKEWVPEYVTIIVWPFEHAAEKPVEWPSNWPGLKSPFSFRQDDSYSIFIEGKELPRVRELLEMLQPNFPLLIEDRKWTASLKYIFPSEHVWFYKF